MDTELWLAKMEIFMQVNLTILNMKVMAIFLVLSKNEVTLDHLKMYKNKDPAQCLLKNNNYCI